MRIWDTHGKASTQIRPPAGAEREGMEILDVRYRLGHVLDYIGVEWETPVAEQMKIGEV